MPQPLRLLALDGGGIRGLSSLYILKQLMDTIAIDEGLSHAPAPSDYFDLIAGTSTGGLIAIMLGRLKMSIDSCIKAYIEMSETIFVKKHHRMTWKGELRGRFSSKALQIAVQKILRDQGLDKNALMNDSDDKRGCKVFVCALNCQTSETVRFKTYTDRQDHGSKYKNVKIWEAARATSAASSFFDSMWIQTDGTDEEFVDGALGANNPITELWTETIRIYGGRKVEQNVKCVVSIGTGIQSRPTFKTNNAMEIVKSLGKISTDTEKIAERFREVNSRLDDSGRYFRFNVSKGLENIGLEEHTKKTTIAHMTKIYLESQDVRQKLKLCASRLEKSTSDQTELVVQNRRTMQIFSRRKCPEKLIDRISNYDHERTHRRLLRKKLEGTTEWFLGHRDFQDWLDGSVKAIWCSGKIGSGKTIIISSIIEMLKMRSIRDKRAVVYFYLESDQRDHTTAFELLSSFVKQLLSYVSEISIPLPVHIDRDVRKYFGRERSIPDWEDIAELFSGLFSHVPNTTFIVDGLDGFNEEDVKRILQLFRKCFGQASTGTSNVLFSSRDQIATSSIEPTRAIPGIRQISTTGNNLEDVKSYIRVKMTEKTEWERPLSRNQALVETVETKLYEKASGMFLWVQLQIETLWDNCFTDDDILRSLEDLPKNLVDIYQRCLDRITEKRYAWKILKWVAFASRPLQLEELQDAVAFGIEDEMWNLQRLPVLSTLLNQCANLVTLDPCDECVRFAHPSVQTYLESGTHLDIGQRELDCGELCVAYLSFSDFRLQLVRPHRKEISISSSKFLAAMLPSSESRSPLMFRVPFRRLASKDPRISLAFSRALNHQPKLDESNYHFLNYATINWIIQTKRLGDNSPVWDRFCQLVSTPNESLNIHPWVTGSQSEGSRIHGIIGWATEQSHLPLLRLALNCLKDPKFKTLCNMPIVGAGLPPLHVASRIGNLEIVELLLPLCKIESLDQFGRNAISHATEKGHLLVTKLLVSTFQRRRRSLRDVDIPFTKKGQTPFEYAVLNGHAEIVEYLMQISKVSASWSNSIRKTVLGDDLLVGQQSRSVMGTAIERGYTEVVRSLLEFGWDPNPGEYNGMSLSAIAAEHNHTEILEMLIEYGADLESPDKRGESNLAHAAISSEGAAESARLLLAKGASIESTDNSGRTPLLHAALKGQIGLNTAVLLLEKGANVEARDKLGRTALTYATISGVSPVKMVELLLNHGAKIDSVDNDGLTPLDRAEQLLGPIGLRPEDEMAANALYQARAPMVKVLIDRGAKPSSQKE